MGTDTVAYVDSLDSGATVGAKQEIKMIDDKFHRSGAYDAYYVASRAKKRRNLTVRTLATVRNILLEKKDGKVAATGVVYADGLTGRTLNVTAKAEVVLSAGALQTPKLMLLSVSELFDSNGFATHQKAHNRYTHLGNWTEKGSREAQNRRHGS